MRNRLGFTLIELLVVIAVIGTLIALSIPAVQMVRETARRTQCKNNLRQLGIAIQSHVSIYEKFPPSFEIEPGTVLTGNNGSWSIHGRILPFVEQNNAYQVVDLNVAWDAQINTGVPTKRISSYVCPSEQNDFVRVDSSGNPKVYPTNYAFNMGSWLIYDPTGARRGDGPFYVNSGVQPGQIIDGQSNTICAAEVKMFTSYIRNTIDPGPMVPTSPDAFTGYSGQLKLGTSTNSNTGHTEWCDGRVHHSGFTTVFTPNTVVPYPHAGRTYDIDFNSVQEGKSATQSTYAAVTARSYHAGKLVNVVMLDGSTKSRNASIDSQIWRSAGTINGGEITTGF